MWIRDSLNGVERPVDFDVPAIHTRAAVVHSLAKWKRLALAEYDFHVGNGLVTDMNAIRRDEEMDNLHSIYVDQWDWEKVITRADRTPAYLQKTCLLYTSPPPPLPPRPPRPSPPPPPSPLPPALPA